jgi:hypothetical protein
VPLLVLALAVAVLAAAGTARAAPPYQGVALDLTRLEPFDCTRAGCSTPAPPNAVCGWITLPEDSAHADNGHTVRIGVAVARTTGANPQPDPNSSCKVGLGCPSSNPPPRPPRAHSPQAFRSTTC